MSPFREHSPQLLYIARRIPSRACAAVIRECDFKIRQRDFAIRTIEVHRPSAERAPALTARSSGIARTPHHRRDAGYSIRA